MSYFKKICLKVAGPLKEELESLKLNNITLTNKLDDSINRSMRGNLVFFNIPEEEGESSARTK